MGLHSGLLLLWLCQPLSVAGNYFQDDDVSNEEIPIYFPEDKNGKCSFPFYYKKRKFYECVQFKAKHRWCSITRNFEGHWKYCSEDDVANCVFPFWYRRMIYWECTEDSEAFGRKWCSLTQNYNKDRMWRYCEL